MNALKLLSNASSPALDSIRVGIDRAFLDTVQNRFSGIGLTPEIMLFVGWTLGLATLLGGITWTINYFIKRGRKGFLPTGTVHDPAEVLRLFELVIAQRSKIELSFSRTQGQAQTVFCSLEEIKSGHLVLEITTKIEAGPHWIGRTVTCFTRIAPPKEPTRSNFYNFNSEIAGLNKQADGSLILTVTVPETLSLKQKRTHLRLEPPMEYMLGLALWPEQLDKHAKPETKIKKWGKPSLLFHASKKDLVRVSNVSAGGMRVDVTRKAVRETGLEFHPGERYILLAELYDPDKQAKERLWCMARVQNRYEDFETKLLEVGVKFLAHGLPTGEKADTMHWRKVSDDGLDKLGNWVSKRNLELFRKRGPT